MKIGNYELERTCGACPEQYDVYRDGKQVGYLRLRHGRFRAAVPNCGGETVYSSNPRGDGSFDDDEREIHLNAAIAAIDAHYASNNGSAAPQAGCSAAEVEHPC